MHLLEITKDVTVISSKHATFTVISTERHPVHCHFERAPSSVISTEAKPSGEIFCHQIAMSPKDFSTTA